jgi:RNA polymerase sigma factor (TIGR02999 family)
MTSISATEQMFQRVYDELRGIAAAKLRNEPNGITLQPTALVHEAYVRMIRSDTSSEWTSPSHLIAIAAEVMRRILVDNARHRTRTKRGGDYRRVDVALESIASEVQDAELLDLDQAIRALADESPDKAQLVVMRYFGGMTIEEACEVLNISRATAHRHWVYARAWLHRFIENGRSDAP